MVAANIALPNTRAQFIPDPGYVIVDLDLSGADAQVVAWEADDESMKDVFRKGLKVHVQNTRDMFPEKWGKATEGEIKHNRIYKQVKTICHATNYGGKASSLAVNPAIRWPLSTTEDFQRAWFDLHPGILEWHRRTTRFLEGSQCWRCRTYSTGGALCESCGAHLGKTISNPFGYRKVFFDPADLAFNEALAWVPQSVVAIVTQRGLLIINDEFPLAQILIQVHDSLVFQVPKREIKMVEDINFRLNEIVVPYPDPLRIPWGCAVSGENWGLCG